MFPMVGVLPAKDTANSYMGKTSLLFIGGLLVAVAVEETNLHRRLALNVLKLVGSDPEWVMLGLMVPTWFLSMWISNTATASMMVPIVEAILQQLQQTAPTDAPPGSSPLQDIIKESNNRYEVAVAKARVGEYGVYRQSAKDIPETPDDTNQQAATQNGQTKRTDADPEEVQKTEDGDVIDDVESNRDDDVEHKRLCKALSLSIAYAANTGGIATLTGTPPNLVFSGQAESLFKKYDAQTGITFSKWMLMAFPLSLLLLHLAWLWLGLFFMRKKFVVTALSKSTTANTTCKTYRRFFKHDTSRKKAVQGLISRETRKLGAISFAEVTTLILFILLALLWLSRKPEFVSGWEELFKNEYVGDSTCAVLIGCLFFVLPAKRPRVFCWRKRRGEASFTPLLTWKVAQRKIPWGIIVLLGGGFAMAKACERSGLSAWLGDQLTSLDALDPWLLNAVITTIVAMATEVTSNTATATLLMPVVFELALRLEINPLYLMSATALATSFAFMMPVATPPNAIVFSQGRLTIPDMAAAGSVMNILSVLSLTLCVNTWGTAIFDLDTFPDDLPKNLTILAKS